MNILDDDFPPYTNAENLIVFFKRTKNPLKIPERSILVSTAENIDAVHDLILSDRRIGIKRIKIEDFIRIQLSQCSCRSGHNKNLQNRFPNG